MKKPVLISMGEPAGVGPDCCVLSAKFIKNTNSVICGDPIVLNERAKILNKSDYIFVPISETKPKINEVPVLPIAMNEKVIPGILNENNSECVLNILKISQEHVFMGDFSSIVTCPVNKHIINKVDKSFIGHTEFFAELDKNKRKPVMMLSSPEMSVALITTHLPIDKVSKSITIDKIINSIKIINNDLKHFFCIKKPKIGICGLNPHAGENGILGREEIDTIVPAINSLKKGGVLISNPLPADTIFAPNIRNNFDVIVAMYHDQGLAVIKSHSFGKCTNITLGLSIIRTSVDHGSAIELAGTGKVNTNSLVYSIKKAIEMTNNNEKYKSKSK